MTRITSSLSSSLASSFTSFSALTMVVSACVGSMLTGPAASAQHAGWVLNGDPVLAGLELPTERKHVHPITSPYTHEDSFVTTDVRAWFLYHDFPQGSAIGGGNAKVYAVQIRAAITDTLQLVAYKDGYLDMNSGAVNDKGWNDVAAGLKWNFLQDWDNDLHASVGLGYEIGIGQDKVLQQDDEVRLWGSVDKGFGKLHVGATANLLLAVDGEDAVGDADRLHWHARADYYACEWFSPVVELNGYHVLSEGDTRPLPFSGVDVANLGGGDGEDVITIGLGGELRVIDDVALRAAYEMPLTNNDDLFGYRWTLSAVYSF